MRKNKIAALLLIFAMALGMFAGCGVSFDASKYLQAQLDNSYKNDSSLIVEQKIDTKENAEKVYEQGLDTQITAFFTGVNVSDDVKSRYREVFADMFSKADYTVGEAEKQSDGTYKVSVDCKKMKIFEPVINEVQEKGEDLDMTASTFYDDFFSLMADCLEKQLQDGVEYGDSQNITVRIEITDKKYTLNTTDINSLMQGMFDLDAVNGN